MTATDNQILTVAQMRAAEQALIDDGTGVDALMQLAGRGAAEWAWRLAWPRPVTVLCGPGNNGGDGYVIAEALRQRGLEVAVVAPLEPATDAARDARAGYAGAIVAAPDARPGGTLIDCLFGSGLARPLPDDLHTILAELAASHPHRIAIDLPSGVASDTGKPLNDGLPDYDLTIALGAWKPAHWLMPGSAMAGERVLVPIGVQAVEGATALLTRPRLPAPAANAHKYSRGLVAVVSGSMPGATLLACRAAMHGGAGYVKLAAQQAPAGCPDGLVVDAQARFDPRLAALLIGPGLGRTGERLKLLREILRDPLPVVLDADAVVMLQPDMLEGRGRPTVATPHEGELAILAGAFGIDGESKLEVARRLAARSGLLVVAKGPDTVIAAPDGRVAMSPPAPSWLSTAGTGDVLAGLVVSRLAAGSEPFTGACEAVWLHGEAARQAGAAFTASDLIHRISTAYSTCL